MRYQTLYAGRPILSYIIIMCIYTHIYIYIIYLYLPVILYMDIIYLWFFILVYFAYRFDIYLPRGLLRRITRISVHLKLILLATRRYCRKYLIMKRTCWIRTLRKHNAKLIPSENFLHVVTHSSVTSPLRHAFVGRRIYRQL